MSNSTDPCQIQAKYIIPPSITTQAYVAVGSVSNFTSDLESCCPQNASSRVQNYKGGSAPQECYYYCAFDGTEPEMEVVLKCTNAKAKAREVKGEVWGSVPVPDWPVAKGGVGRRSGFAAWKWAVLGLVIASVRVM